MLYDKKRTLRHTQLSFLGWAGVGGMQTIKKAGLTGLFYGCGSGELCHCLDARVQAALVASRLVGVDLAFAGHFVYYRYSGGVSGYSLFFVASDQCFNHLLNGAAQLATLGGIALTVIFRLAGALFSLCSVCQGVAPKISEIKNSIDIDVSRRATMLEFSSSVNG